VPISGLVAEFEFERNYPPTINSAAEAEFCREVMADLVGDERVQVQEPTMGAEDFSYMLLAKPGCYASSQTATASTATWATVAGRACCTTPATTSTTR
jgi:metal-dependent amidase/aminoacylase/carboxypeptidase family protein